MVQRRRKLVLHSQSLTFILRLQKYFYLEKINKGALLPLSQVNERVAEALRLTPESVTRITERKSKKKPPKVLFQKDKKYGVTKKECQENISKFNEVRTVVDTEIKQLKEEEENVTFMNEDTIIECSESSINNDTTEYFNSFKSEINLKTDKSDDKLVKSLNYHDYNVGSNYKLVITSEKQTDNINIKSEHSNKRNKENRRKTSIRKNEHFIINEDRNLVTCKICSKSVVFKTRNLHLKRCHPTLDNRDLLECEFCNKYFVEYKLKNHILLMHGVKRLKCAYCQINFPSKESLKEHAPTCAKRKRKRVTRLIEIELVECNICHKEMQRASLKLHKNRIHFGMAPVCEHCGKTFGNRNRLLEHYRAKHGYDKLKCTRCDFTCSIQVSLENHERLHDGIKPFICDFCGASFHAAYLLNQHRKSHNTMKTFQCDKCPSSFKSNNSLHSHKASCHTTTSYSCKCGKVFACLNYAKKHVKQNVFGGHEIVGCIKREGKL